MGWWMGTVGGFGSLPSLYFLGKLAEALLYYDRASPLSISTQAMVVGGTLVVTVASFYLILKRRSFGGVTKLDRGALVGSVALALAPLALVIMLSSLYSWNCHSSLTGFYHCHPFFDAWHIH